MRRFIIVLASIALIMLNRPALTRPAQAAPHLQLCAQVRITSPAPGAELRGIVPIEGSAAIGDFQFYKVEYAPATQPNLWTSFSDIVRTPVVNGVLDTWNTTLLPDGIYHLKLTAVDIRGQEVCRWIVENLRVANTQPTATPTEEAPPTLPVPTATPTPLITATPTQPTTPTPTPTIAAIIPTRQPSLPALDALRDSVEEAIDPQRLVDLTLLGAGVTTAIFVIVGLVSLLRRII